MSALGQKQTCAAQKVMSALPPIADMCGATRDVRFVPEADIAHWTVRLASLGSLKNKQHVLVASAFFSESNERLVFGRVVPSV